MLRLDFLRLYATEDVVLKRLWPAEELCFGSAHLHARIEFEGNHVQCADEIRKLEKSVFGRADSLCELYGAREMLAEDIGKKLGTGAYLTALRRTKIGDYHIEDAKKVML
jgi:hypothetical protein